MDEPTKPTTTSFADFMNSKANDDVLLEIFTRLPNFRTVCHCAAVCRRWRSVISHPEFLPIFKRNRRPSQPLPFTLLLRDYRQNRHASLEIFSDESKILHGPERTAGDGGAYLNFLPEGSVVRSSCKDLLLVQLSRSHVCVCNPLTRQWVPLPEPPPLWPDFHHPQVHYSFGLVCDPNSESHFRVVAIHVCFLLMIMRVAVFRSDTGRWDEHVRSVPQTYGLARLFMTVATSNGVIYSPMVGTGRLTYEKIAAFDPFHISETLMYREINLPTNVRDSWILQSNAQANLGVVRGGLRLWLTYYSITEYFVFKLWQLKEECDEWEQLHKLRFEASFESKFTYTTLVMALDQNEDDIFFFKDDSPEIWKYYIMTGNCEKVGHVDNMRPGTVVYTIVHQPCPTTIPKLHSV